MGRQQRPGDWAAWMEPGTPAVPARDPGQPREAEPVATPAAEPSATAGSPATQVIPPTDGGANGSEPTGDHGRSPRREATRQRILDAAREVFAEMGVIGGTVEDICERAGFTRGAFYSNFIDKDDVLQALIEREHATLLEHLDVSFALVDKELAQAPDLATAVAAIVDRILRSVPVDRQLSLVQTEMEIHAVRRPDLARPFLEANDRFRSRIAVFLEATIARNGLELTVDAADVVDASVAVVERSVRRALLAGDGGDPDAMARQVLPAMILALSRPAPGGRGT